MVDKKWLILAVSKYKRELEIIFISSNAFRLYFIANMAYVFWILSISTPVTDLFIFLKIFYYFRAFDRGSSVDNANENPSTGRSSFGGFTVIAFASADVDLVAVLSRTTRLPVRISHFQS